MTIKAQTTSSDAWLAYDRLLADGEISIAVHFGWDYWDRYDLKGSRNLYNYLVAQGFASPVASYDKMDRTSGPLTKTIKSNGKPVNVKIWIFHPGDPANHVLGPDPDTDAGGKILEADMRDSLAHREVIVFEGHSGPLYGFALANWRKTDEGDMDDSKLPTAEMPRSYQIVLANGCDTYDLGQAFWANPAKSDHTSLNVITTTNFSNAGTEASAERLLEGAVQPDERQARAVEGVGSDPRPRHGSGLRLQLDVRRARRRPRSEVRSDVGRGRALPHLHHRRVVQRRRQPLHQAVVGRQGVQHRLHRRHRLPDGLRLPRGGGRDLAHDQDPPVRPHHGTLPVAKKVAAGFFFRGMC